jgi:hypothetical protein
VGTDEKGALHERDEIVSRQHGGSHADPRDERRVGGVHEVGGSADSLRDQLGLLHESSSPADARPARVLLSIPYYQYLYSDSPEQACYKWGLKRHGQYNGKARKIAADTANCFLDDNNNGIDDDPKGTSIFFETIDREWCCEVDVEGPHSGLNPDVYYLSWRGNVVQYRPKDGEYFTSQTVYDSDGDEYLSQVDQVRAQNSTQNAVLFTSDLKGSSELPFEYCGGDLYTNSPNLGCRPQVDHIIPRKDIKGCDCGSNSFKNALLISAQLNNQMSNYCGDPNDPTDAAERKAIIEKYRVD